MSAIKYADVNVGLTVKFEDDGSSDLNALAIEAAEEALSVISFNFIDEVMDVDVIGPVRDTPMPKQPARSTFNDADNQREEG